MGCLYIAGVQCKHAMFKDYDDYELFDKQKEKMRDLAFKFDIHIARYKLNDDDSAYSYVITNTKPNHKCFYEGAAFDVDMSVKTSDTFDQRADQFIDALEKETLFDRFHSLSWSKTQVLYFCIS